MDFVVFSTRDIINVVLCVVLGAALLWAGIAIEKKEDFVAKYKTLPRILRVGGLLFLVLAVSYFIFLITVSS